MGNPLQTIPNLPPAIGLSGAEQLWISQAGVDKRTTTAAIAALLLGEVGSGGGGLTVSSYAALRLSAFPVAPGAPTPVIVLADPRKGGVFVPVPLPVSQPFMARDNGGTIIVDSLGQPWQRVYDERINAGWFYSAPGVNPTTNAAYYFGDNSGLTITAADQLANPQWIGMPDGSGPYPVGTYWDYVALQEWLYACCACRSTPYNMTTTPPTPGILWNITYGSYQLNQPGYCPAGLFRINQQLMLNATGANLDFASRRGGPITWYGNNLGTDPTTPGFLMNSLAYSQIDRLTMQDGIGCTTALISIDHQPGFPGFVGGLSPQLNSFRDWFVGGAYGNPTWAGVGISLAGGAAQGDTQQFQNIFIGQCANGVVLGGDNAIGVVFIGGNMTNCTRGVANIGAGSFTSINLLTEGDVYNYYGYPHADQLTMDGCDFFSSEVSTESSLVIGNRSESMVFAIDTNYLLEVQTSAIAYAGVSGWQPNAHYHDGYGIGVTGGRNWTVAVLADDGGPPWFLGTLDATGLVITNAFTGVGGIANGILTLSSVSSATPPGPGQFLSGPGIPAGVMITDVINVPAGDGRGTYRLMNAGGLTVAAGTAISGSPNWTVNQWANYGIWLRYGSNGYSQSNGIASSTANTLTLVNPYPKLSYPLGFKLFLSGGPNTPNWASLNPATDFGKTQRSSTGYQWTTLAGSNFVQGIAPPVGAWVMVCGAYLFNQQSVTGSGKMPGPLFGKVGSATPACAFQGYVVGNVLTVQSITTSGGVIAIGTSVSGGGNILQQLTPAPPAAQGGVGTYLLDQSMIYPITANFWAGIDDGHGNPGNTLTIQQMYSGALAVGNSIASNLITGTPQVTAQPSQAAFTGRIDNGTVGQAGNVLTVSAVTSGALALNQTVSGAGVAANTTITGMASGTTGGAGVYYISGGVQSVASEAMTSIITGVGTYTISGSPQFVPPHQWTTAGQAQTVTAMSTTQGFALVNRQGNPVNAGISITNGQGYWSQPVMDEAVPGAGGLTWMAVDFDVLYGIKRTRGVQIGGYGKATQVGELELDYGTPTVLLTSNFLRDTAPNGLASPNYRPHPEIGMTTGWTAAWPSPYTLAVGAAVGQIGSTKALYFYCPGSATLNFPVLQPNVSMDVELVLQSWAATPPVITWGTNVRAAAATLTLGAQNTVTIVKLKWWGSLQNSVPANIAGAWLVTSIQGPM